MSPVSHSTKRKPKRVYVKARDLPNPGQRSVYNQLQTAAVLGVSGPTIARLWKSGELGSIHIGRRRLCRHQDIETFLASAVAS